jgi:hypothetical protein
VTESQMAALAGQSAGTLHPTQSPVAVLQSGALFGQDPLPVHAAWQARSDAQHAGVVLPQSALDRHVTQAPATQWLADAGQFASAMQSTHPSVASHCCDGPHWLVPFAPHSALSTVVPFAPPHATNIATTTMPKPQNERT